MISQGGIIVIAKGLGRAFFLNSKHTKHTHQHGYKTQHSTVTALYTLNNTVAMRFNQMAFSARTIIVALDMRNAFDKINIRTLIRKLPHTKIPGTIIKFIVNYTKGHKTYIKYINHTSSHSKVAFHKVASFHQHYSTYTLQTYHHPEHRFRSWPTQMTSPSHQNIRAIWTSKLTTPE